MKPHAIGYLRFSSKLQKIGSSEHRQEGGFSDFVKSSALPAWKEVYFDKGESAYHGNHRQGDFGKLLNDCQTKKLPSGSVVWVEDMDRFSRQKLATVLADLEIVTGNGYGLHVASLGQTFTAATGEMERIGAVMKSILAREESEKKSSRLKKAKERFRETGVTKSGKLSACCPTWISVSDEGTKYVFNEKAETLKTACIMAIDGHGQGSIRKALGLEGMSEYTNLAHTFRSRALIGEYQPRFRTKNREKAGEAKQGFYPALLTLNQFHQLQAALDSRRLQHGKRGKFCTNLFTMLYNADDGEKLVVRRPDGKTTMLASQGALKKKPGSVYRQIDYQTVENVLLSCFIEIDATMLNPAQAKVESEVDKINGKIADMEARIATWEEEALEGAAGLSKLISQGTTKLTGWKEERDALQAKATVNPCDDLSSTHDLIDAMKKLKGQELLDCRVKLKALVTSLVEKVVLQRNGNNPKSITVEVTLTSGTVLKGDGCGWKHGTIAIREMAG